MTTSNDYLSPLPLLGQRIALVGLLLYVVFAPHSVAAASIGIALAGLGWAIRTVGIGTLRLHKSKFDLIILLSLVWTFVSSLLSAEPAISLLKLRSLWCVFIFYLVRAVASRRSVVILAILLIASSCVGTFYSIYDLARGRGVVVESIAADSPLQRAGIGTGDTIWRTGQTRIYSLLDLDNALRSVAPDKEFSISVISQGEHVERRGVFISTEEQKHTSPSGVMGNKRSHRFRASGWTRHYETFAELLQMIAQLALGIALANFRNHGANKAFRLALIAAGVVTLGVALTAMRTVLIALVIGAVVVAWRSLRGAPKLVFGFILCAVLAFGAVVVWETRAQRALSLEDPSSTLRWQVARVGLSRVFVHPVFGHGMDAMQRHWSEWGFPGQDMLHLHSTPLQLAFDRGLPMVAIWLWLIFAFWIYIARAERKASDASDTTSYGLLLGSLGSLTGFFASSLVNYNYGDSEVAMLFWWIMGTAVVLYEHREHSQPPHKKSRSRISPASASAE